MERETKTPRYPIVSEIRVDTSTFNAFDPYGTHTEKRVLTLPPPSKEIDGDEAFRQYTLQIANGGHLEMVRYNGKPRGTSSADTDTDTNADRVVLVAPQLLDDPKKPDMKYTAQAISRAFGGCTVIIMANPGCGRSAKIPASAMKEIRKTGSFLPYAEGTIDAINKELASFDGATLIGASHGGRIMLAQAALMDSSEQDKRRLVLFDPPGTVNLGLLGLAKRFIIDEGGELKRYLEEFKQAEKERGYSLPATSPSITSKLAKLIRNRSFWQVMIEQTSAMSKSGLTTDIEKLLASESVCDLRIISPALSHLNNPYMMKYVMEQAIRGNQETERNQKIMRSILLGRITITHDILPEHSHAVTGWDGRILGSLATSLDNLRTSPRRPPESQKSEQLTKNRVIPPKFLSVN